MARSGRDEPRPVTAAALEKAALHYLERFASSAENLRRVLMRRVRRAAVQQGGDAAEGAALVEALIARLRRSGLLDDRRYAEAKAASLHRGGGSRRAITGRLAQAGVEAGLIGEALAGIEEIAGDIDLAAACAFIRRRRLGAYRVAGGLRDKSDKDMAALARAGFSFEIARKVLACRDIEAVEALVREED